MKQNPKGFQRVSLALTHELLAQHEHGKGSVMY